METGDPTAVAAETGSPASQAQRRFHPHATYISSYRSTDGRADVDAPVVYPDAAAQLPGGSPPMRQSQPGPLPVEGQISISTYRYRRGIRGGTLAVAPRTAACVDGGRCQSAPQRDVCMCVCMYVATYVECVHSYLHACTDLGRSPSCLRLTIPAQGSRPVAS